MRTNFRRFCAIFAVFTAIIVSLVLTGITPVFPVAADDGTAVYYLNSQKGSDSNSGASPTEALKTFEKICSIASGDITVVLTGECDLKGGIDTPVEHKGHITFTSVYGGKDYRVDGAGFVLGKGSYYRLGGDTTFENVSFRYNETLHFEAGYNALTFGEGIEFKNLSSGKGVYVYGGWRYPVDGCDIKRDSHLSFESGKYYLVIAGSRDRKTGTSHKIFEGTHYLNISGGEFDIVYGGSHAAHASANVVINVSGGKIGKLAAAGDVSRRLTGNAVMNLTGGTVSELLVNNITGRAEVTLGGAKVSKCAVSYYNVDLEKMAKEANEKKILRYNRNFYSASEIDRFSAGFDILENITYIYAAVGASGSGNSPSDPTSFDTAMENACEAGATVWVSGTVSVDNFVEKKHEKPIVICSADGGELVISGAYTLGGSTTFSNVKLSGSGELVAVDGHLTVDSTAEVEGKFNVRGNATLKTGRFEKISDAHSLIVAGAEVNTVIGGNDKTKIELTSGNIGTLKSADTTVSSFTLTVGGGKLDTLVVKGVTGELVLNYYGGTVGETVAEGSNARGTYSVANGMDIASIKGASSIFTDKAVRVVYAMDGAKGSGASPSDPTSFDKAYKALPEGGIIVVCGEVVLEKVYRAPEHEGVVKLTSVYGGADYRTSGARIVLENSLFLGGDAEIDGISIISRKENAGVYCLYNNVTFGTDITNGYEGTSNTYPCITAGDSLASEDGNGNITVNGGKWQRLRLGNASSSALSCNVVVTVNGGEFHGFVYLSSSGDMHDGSSTLILNDGYLYSGILGFSNSKLDALYWGDMKVVLNGGTVYNVISARYEDGIMQGSFSLEINGGDFSHLTDIDGYDSGKGFESKLTVDDSIDLDAELTGTYTFTNYLRGGADPWMFYHDGAYYYVATGGRTVRLYKCANIGDLEHGISKVIYNPPDGEDFSKDLWSPEIHYFTDEEAGEGNGGWYLFIGGQNDVVENFSGIREYVVKCLDGDDLLGNWGNPITGQINIPQKVEIVGTEYNVTESGGGCSVFRIDGKTYVGFVTSVGRDTVGTDDYYFYQKLMLCNMENPWTLHNATEICRPEYDWEKGGASSTHPQVVEGLTAVYGDDGTVFAAYSGSGYWTTEYNLAYLKFLGGDPLNKDNWEKCTKPFLYKSAEINGCGHASYFTDTDGTRWVCYHAYLGKDTKSGRFAFVEPYIANAEQGIVVAEGTGHPAPIDREYTVNVNPQPIRDKLSGFTFINGVRTNAPDEGEKTDTTTAVGDVTTEAPSTTAPEPPEDNGGIAVYLIAGVAVIVVAVLVILVIVKKKK
ncbi:MAG: family 43 glycosylhydrolase [Clostridia bacterium]|nr:family 43 glycosylhydrolase [Clostridia bacterium]